MEEVLRTIARVLFCLSTLVAGVSGAQAQGTYPDKPIRLLIPYAPGGSTDLTGRIYGEALQKALGQNVVVENRPGAAGTIGIDVVAKAKPDGYTLGVSGVGPTAIAPFIDSKTPYQPLRDLDIIAGLSIVDVALVALPNSKYNTMKDAVEDARANPDKVSIGTSGVAGPIHLDLENLSLQAKVKFIHAPFQGDVPAITSVLSGDVAIGWVSAASAQPFLTSGKLKALAAGGPQRLKTHPDLLTIAEQTDYKDFETYTWNVLVAPKGTPKDVLEKLNKAINDAATKPEVKDRLENIALKVMPGDQAWAQEFVNKAVARNRKLIDATGLKRE